MQNLNSISKQKGAVVILMAFIIGLGAIAYLLHALDPQRLRLEQDKKTMQTLNEAKKALIAWSVSHPNHPGIMPFPDRNDDLPQGYDDKSDCVTAGVTESQLLGRLPLLSDVNCVSPQVGIGIDGRDTTDERLWYSVSINLVRMSDASATPVINPSIVNPVLPTQPWFVVRDRNGTVISDRVAVVIIAPGTPLPNQDRSGGIADADQYLDKIVMADNKPYRNYGYPTLGVPQEFIIGDDYRVVAKDDPTYKTQSLEPYYFNDKLVYITIDELMAALERRVLEQTKNTLNAYYSANNFYPFAAGLGSSTNPNQCTQGNLRGLLPTKPPLNHTCTCSAATRTCNCSFGVVSSTSFTRSTGSFVATGGGANAPTGACLVSLADTKTCACNGAGSCKRATGAVQFSCDACGSCKATVAGTNKFTTTGNFTASAGSCSNSASQVSCVNSADGTFTLGACNNNQMIKSLPSAGGMLPQWFTANQWEKYIVYAVSSDCTSLSACAATNSPPKLKLTLSPNLINALAATSLVNPSGSCSIASYLSATQNTDVIVSNGMQDDTYQKTLPRTNANSDQLVVIP